MTLCSLGAALHLCTSAQEWLASKAVVPVLDAVTMVIRSLRSHELRGPAATLQRLLLEVRPAKYLRAGGPNFSDLFQGYFLQGADWLYGSAGNQESLHKGR